MKCLLRSVLLFASTTLLCMGSITGQSTEIYGLQSADPMDLSSPLNLVQMNPTSGVISPMFTVQNSNSVSLGSSTYDHGQKRFIYWGFNAGGQSNYYSVGTLDSSTNFTPLSGAGFPIELQYDLQHDSLYGLSYDQATSTQYFVSVDLANGTKNQIATIPGVQGVLVGNSAFNSNTGQYAFHGGAAGQYRQYILDAQSGQVVHSPLLPSSSLLRGLQYDLTTNKLLTLAVEYDSTMYDPAYLSYYQRTYLAEIDTLTAAITKLSNTSVLEGYQTGIIAASIDFDQANQQYLFLGADENTGFRLIMVDALTGQATVDVETSGFLLEMEVDNQVFARTQYGNPTFIGDREEFSALKLYPNPAQARIQLELGNSTSHLKQLELWDMQGRRLREVSFAQQISHRQELSIESLSPGFYVIKAWDQQGNAYRASLLKE